MPLNLQRLSYIALLRSGRTLAADWPPLSIADTAQKRLLTMLGIDGAIAAATEVDYSMELCACAGSRLWLLRKAQELGLDVYAQLLGGSRRREVSCDCPKRGCRAACELRLTVDPSRLELHFESILRSEGDVYDGTPMVDATCAGSLGGCASRPGSKASLSTATPTGALHRVRPTAARQLRGSSSLPPVGRMPSARGTSPASRA